MEIEGIKSMGNDGLWRSLALLGMSLTLGGCWTKPNNVAVAPSPAPAPSAIATPSATPSAADRKQAGELRQKGLKLRRQGQLGVAIAAFARSTTLDPTSLDGWVLLGWTQHLAGKDDAATVSLQSALKQKADHVPALNALGIVYLVKGNLPAAVTTHQQALALKPNNEIAHYNLALAYDRLQQYDRAIAHAQSAAQLEPNNPHPLAILAIAHWHKGDRTAALQTYRKAIALDPRYRDRAVLAIDLKAAAFSPEQIESVFALLRAYL